MCSYNGLLLKHILNAVCGIISSEVSCRDCEMASFPHASLYSYKVKKLDNSKEDVITAKASQLRRAKGVYTREKNRILLKHFSEQKQMVWVIKVS
jgi:hypothetical protein